MYEIFCRDCNYFAFDTNSKGACKNCGGGNLTEDKNEIEKMERYLEPKQEGDKWK